MEERTRTEQNGLITEELRDWMGAATHNTIGTELIMGSYNKLLAIADRIDEQHAKARDKAYDEGVCDGIDADKNAMGYVKGPVDADGVPWHLGDKVDGMVGSITYLSLGYIGWTFSLGDAYTFQCEEYRHYHAPTVEDVLRECIANVCRSNAELHEQGCPPLTMEDIDEELDEYINEYATRLRLAEEAE